MGEWVNKFVLVTVQYKSRLTFNILKQFSIFHFQFSIINYLILSAKFLKTDFPPAFFEFSILDLIPISDLSMKLGFGSFDMVSWKVIGVELRFAPTGLASSLTLPRGEGTCARFAKSGNSLSLEERVGVRCQPTLTSSFYHKYMFFKCLISSFGFKSIEIASILNFL